LSTKGGIAKDGVGLQDLIADRKSCFCSKDSKSCDLLINQPPVHLNCAVHTLHDILFGDLDDPNDLKTLIPSLDDRYLVNEYKNNVQKVFADRLIL
jgi:hypothetical protein